MVFFLFEPVLQVYDFLQLFSDQHVNRGDCSRMTAALWSNSGVVCVTSEEATFSYKWPAR